MLEQIKAELAKLVPLESKNGLFISGFDAEDKLLFSNGVVKTDRSIETLAQNFYTGIISKQATKIKKLILDVVINIKLENDPNTLIQLPIQERGLFLVQGDGQNSGVLLPNTKGISTIQQGLTAIKQKYNLTNQVSVFVFQTKRSTISMT
ncbi:MAG: hypothetical protein DLD55_00330 [candidate division SR1 bacterium]|nr:MAG: hypothetical protein DLD55_00330 [candidate division SR1 bacterium]